MEEPQSSGYSPQNSGGGFPVPQFQGRDVEGKGEGKEGLQNQDGLKILPFEFVALEACLEAACSVLENEVNLIFGSGFSICSLFFCSVKFLLIFL